MNCKFNGQITIEISCDGNYLSFQHCCFLSNELIEYTSTEEFISQLNLKSYLEKLFSENPKNHNFYPSSSDCNKSYCDFSQEKLTMVTVSHEACNLNCKMCVIKKPKGNDVRASLETYFLILNKLKGLNLSHIQLSSVGEPFLDKRIVNFISKLMPSDTLSIGFVTNATLLNKSDIKLICESTQNNRVQITPIISCDGITSETYKKVRNIDAFNRVVENILEFKKYNKLYCVNFVITPDNIHELKEVPEFWLSKGVTPRIIYPICHPEWDWMREDPRIKFIQENYSQYYVNN